MSFNRCDRRLQIICRSSRRSRTVYKDFPMPKKLSSSWYSSPLGENFRSSSMTFSPWVRLAPLSSPHSLMKLKIPALAHVSLGLMPKVNVTASPSRGLTFNQRMVSCSLFGSLAKICHIPHSSSYLSS